MNTEYSDLENPGMFALNCEQLETGSYDRKTFIVLGAPRGGTSAIAGALAALGLFMGKGAGAPVFESLALANAIEKRNDDQVRELISEFNSEHDIWAFKRPGFTRFVADYHPFFRNPVYIIIFRDPVATASRSLVSGRLKANYTKKLKHVLSIYNRIIEFVNTSQAPAVFVSYEKLLGNPTQFLEELTRVIHLQASAEALQDAANFVEPSPDHYLEASRANRIEGRWQIFSARKISGWARYVNKTMMIPPKIALYRSSQEIATVTANLSAQLPEGVTADGRNCGFEFDLEKLGISVSTELRVRVLGDIRDFDPPAYTGPSSLMQWLVTFFTLKRNKP